MTRTFSYCYEASKYKPNIPACKYKHTKYTTLYLTLAVVDSRHGSPMEVSDKLTIVCFIYNMVAIVIHECWYLIFSTDLKTLICYFIELVSSGDLSGGKISAKM